MTVTLPKAIDGCPPSSSALFLDRLAAANRCARHAAGGAATFVARSEPLARQVQHLLLRLRHGHLVALVHGGAGPVYILEEAAPIEAAVARRGGGDDAVEARRGRGRTAAERRWRCCRRGVVDRHRRAAGTRSSRSSPTVTEQVYDLTVPERAQLRRRRRVRAQHRVRASAWRRTWPCRATSRCCSSRSRWATAS